MAPEQIRGTPAVSHKTDLYALGVVFYQMLAGKPPFEGSTPVVLMHCHLNEPPPRPSAKVEEIPKALDELVVNLMAKAPADRPWDAAAVGASSSELRDKAEKGKSIAMVWPGRGRRPRRTQGSSPTPGAGPTERRKKKSRKTTFARPLALDDRNLGSGATRLPSRHGSTVRSSRRPASRRRCWSIGGFIAYWVWPPEQSVPVSPGRDAHGHDSRHDWRTALDEYIKPLDERFPDHPYREKTNAWRDKIMLEEVEGRASILESPVKTAFNEPKDNHERGFVLTRCARFRGIEARRRPGGHRRVAEICPAAKPDDPERAQVAPPGTQAGRVAWKARSRCAAQYVERQLQARGGRLCAGHTNQGVAIKNKVREQYQKYTDLADLFPPTPASGEAATANGAAGKATSPARTPAGSDTVPEAADGPKRPLQTRPTVKPCPSRLRLGRRPSPAASQNRNRPATRRRPRRARSQAPGLLISRALANYRRFDRSGAKSSNVVAPNSVVIN